MAIQHLLASLEQAAAAEAERVVAEARAEADRIAAGAAERSAKRRDEVLRAREVAWREEAAATLAEARRGARRHVFAARQSLMERVLAAARERLDQAITGDGYLAALPSTLAEALAYVGEEPAVIRCSPSLARPLRQLVANRATLRVEPTADASPGLVVSTVDGALTVDATLTDRLDRLAPSLALEIATRIPAVT